MTVGWYGVKFRFIKYIFASLKVLLPFRLLQFLHEVTVFSNVFFPPFERGKTWSMFKFSEAPQYTHLNPSRTITFFFDHEIANTQVDEVGSAEIFNDVEGEGGVDQNGR